VAHEPDPWHWAPYTCPRSSILGERWLYGHLFLRRWSGDQLELLVGELASVRQAALPILGALGGVIVPALIYAILNFGGAGSGGWGIPMATDIAFVIGIMALLGDGAPVGPKIFLTALAIVDDIAAILVIGLFYTADIAWLGVGVAAFCVLLLLVANRMGVRHRLPYVLLVGKVTVQVN
jgi:NhaA family Na+:H+ antiporter